jgi:putative thioredoxin
MSLYAPISAEQVGALKTKPAPVPSVIKFSAAWCGPCKAMSPRLEQLANDYTQRVEFHEFDATERAVEAKALGVTTVPTIHVVLPNGELKSFNGPMADRQVKMLLDKVVGL